MHSHDIPSDVRAFAIKHFIALGRYGRGYTAEGHYYIRNDDDTIALVSKFKTTSSAFTMIRAHLRNLKLRTETGRPGNPVNIQTVPKNWLTLEALEKLVGRDVAECR